MAEMTKTLHITVNVHQGEWQTEEGLKTLCGNSTGLFVVRFQLFENYLKAHMLKDTDVCAECLEIYRELEQQTFEA